MKGSNKFTSGWIVLTLVVAPAALLLTPPAEAQLPSPGNNAVYNSSGTVVLSPAFIDASVFVGAGQNQGSDICDVLFKILTGNPNFFRGGYPSSGAVIDARGISGTTNLTCTHGTPWTEGSNTVSVPSTILLPATTGATSIVIPSTWFLPPNTHLIGEGDSITSGGFTPGTTLLAATNFTGTAMISFGSSSLCSSPCTGIAVENLTLNGQGQSIDGIDNGFSQDSSYVDHVSLFQIRGTGLSLSGNANNSGPYSNITFDTGSYVVLSSTVCASIRGLTNTHGIHGLTCISATNDADAAILLDSSNNSLKDIRIVGFYDGIRVGANADAHSNVLVNIIGDTLPGNIHNPPPIIVVHIKSVGHSVSDLSIMGANNAGGSSGTITIQDDLTGAQLNDTSVGIYALGEQASGGIGYSRYTTSPNAATWAAGTNFPSGNCSRGSLYSCTGSSNSCGSFALWACALSGNSVQWMGVR